MFVSSSLIIISSIHHLESLHFYLYKSKSQSIFIEGEFKIKLTFDTLLEKVSKPNEVVRENCDHNIRTVIVELHN